MNSMPKLIITTLVLVTMCNAAPEKPAGPKYYKELTSMPQYEDACICAQPVIIKYYAPWCAACTQMEPVYNKAAQKYKDKARFYAVNVDEKHFKPLIKKHNIGGLPTTIFMKNNKEVKRERGSITSQEELDQSVDSVVNGPKSLMITRKAEEPAKRKTQE